MLESRCQTRGWGIRALHAERQFVPRNLSKRLARGRGFASKGAGKGLRPLVVASAKLDKSLSIKIGLAKSLDRLDLSNCGLTKIPEEVFELEDLRDLSLTGNSITHLPEGIGNLKSLERFVIAGNLLQELPKSLGNLKALEGFWCHGNLIKNLPESFGELSALKKCSLSGNRIESLPNSIGGLTNLEVLEVAGNRLKEIPGEIKGLSKLKKLVLHGNEIEVLPAGLGDCSSLEELMVQGNRLKSIDCGAVLPSRLKTLNVADNVVEELAGEVQHLGGLENAVLYGNKLKGLPEGLLGLPCLKNVWLEGNPFSKAAVGNMIESSVWGPALRKLGLDESQVDGLGGTGLNNSNGKSSTVQLSELRSSGPGYFKLVKRGAKVLVVAFGSAPGETNWSGLLGRVQKGKNPEDEVAFDTLYVVDPAREWFGGGDESFNNYRAAIESTAKSYDTCVMIGESMGASAALMLAQYATSVLAFCPQVNLEKSSIRPSSGKESWEAVRTRVLDGVAKSNAEVTVFSGNWDHDIGQVQQLDQSKIKWKVFGVDSHRLAMYLDMNQKLVPVVRAAMGFPTGEVRLSNLF
ncbi:hypothetical protein BSKO_11416 [Bryopsis sp. KO-2023]|nr:hypothetical protein BSKO_11416 [Bryopsis sp. KO-2023]